MTNVGLKSWLGDSQGNLFQRIKKKTDAAIAEGKTIVKLSIGEPSGPAPFIARQAAAEAVMSEKEDIHRYQDNGSPGVPDFAKRFVHAIVPNLANADQDRLAYLPIPGIKPMLGIIPQACGGVAKGVRVATMTDPGYPTPYDQCKIQGIPVQQITLSPEDNFIVSAAHLEKLRLRPDLIMLNYPHNPSGQCLSVGHVEELCSYASRTPYTRLFFDVAYAPLHHKAWPSLIADVAVRYPRLSWAAAYSASKMTNMTGWRIGAIVGSPDFVSDIARLKESSDSGFNPSASAGVIALCEKSYETVTDFAEVYENRLSKLSSILLGAGMIPAADPAAGFFSLWKCPTEAFGKRITDAEQFTDMLIGQHGVVCVPFGKYVRCAVCTDAVDQYPDIIKQAFAAAEVSYDQPA